jgi:hypothetical protein
MALGLNEILDENHFTSKSELICLSDCELMLIPRIYIIKSYKIKYKLEDKESGELKSRRIT